MSKSVIAHDLGKRYVLGEGAAPHTTLGETLARLSHRRRARPSRDEIWALRHVDLEVEEGEAIGIVGRNGAGKSTLLKILARITEPTSGNARIRGRLGVLLEVGTGFHHELTGRENIFLNGVVLGMARREVHRRFDDIVEFAGISQFLDTPLKRYSSGMYLRLAFAVAAHLDPDVMIVDEVLAVGDFEFQRRCLGKVSALQREGRTVLFVSHDLAAVSDICSRAVWIEQGEIAQDGRVEDVLDAYLGSGSGEGAMPPPPSGLDGPVRVRSIALVNEHGEVTREPSRDQPFGIEVEFELFESVRAALDVELWLVNARGVPVIDESWEDARSTVGRPTAAGTYKTRLHLPAVLATGDYTVFMWIGNEYEELVPIVELFRFTLRPLAQDLSAYELSRPGRVVHVDARWTLEKTASTQHA